MNNVDDLFDDLEEEEAEERAVIDELVLTSALRALVDMRQMLQLHRIAFSGRVRAVEQGFDTTSDVGLLNQWLERFMLLEHEADKDIRNEAQKYEIINRMICVKGVGLLLAARLVSMVDISRDDTVSSLWRYCGFAVVDGKRERPVKGVKLHYNKKAKIACINIAMSFLKTRSPYREIYDKSRVYYQEVHPEWSKKHNHEASMRRMIKLFLSHVWVEWRKCEGLPITQPYAQDILKHTTYISPQEMGWPS